VAAALEAPLDLVLVRKIGVPFQRELAMGAVVDGIAPIVVRNDNVIRQAGIADEDFKSACDRELAEIDRRRKYYLGNRRPVAVDGCTAIVVDDGIATGATTRAALQATRMRNPKALVLAIPVAPTESLDELSQETDDIVCLEQYDDFGAIGLYYADFRQISDEEVIRTLARFPVRTAGRSKLSFGIT
jgi:predicted phosphoribosyltransferase